MRQRIAIEVPYVNICTPCDKQTNCFTFLNVASHWTGASPLLPLVVGSTLWQFSSCGIIENVSKSTHVIKYHCDLTPRLNGAAKQRKLD